MKNLDFLVSLLCANSKEVREEIIKHGKDYKLKVSDLYVLFENPNAKADITLVCHYDTVFDSYPQKKNICLSGNLLTTDGKTILGADDRAGVYLCLELAKYSKYTLFCDLEEVGGDGAELFCQENPYFKTKAFIELDRMNDNDAVFYHHISEAFEDYILSYGWQRAFGSFSDISILSPFYNIPSVNLSVGYNYQHSTKERLDLEVLERTKERVKDMLLEFERKNLTR